ncbi:LSU ribosomal protein L5P [Thermoplasmatales archaeon SCGC AB-539-C06]|nr:LSU ribosomal protein L5P [Thermoplasmatales archaeon SCGC AB-539-C06]
MNKTKDTMAEPRIEKITVNIGVGEGGEKLQKAENVLESLTGQKPVRTISKTISKDWDLRKKMPIGCKVTLRGKVAEDFLIKALETRDNKVAAYSFDDQGNLSFGIPDHTLFKDQRYNPEIGIFGMDVCITIEKPGYRVKRRNVNRSKIPARHQVNWEESISFLSAKYKVAVIE